MKTHILIFYTSIFIISCKSSQRNEHTSEKRPNELSMDRNAGSLLLDPTINAISLGVYKDGEAYINHHGELEKGKAFPKGQKNYINLWTDYLIIN